MVGVPGRQINYQHQGRSTPPLSYHRYYPYLFTTKFLVSACLLLSYLRALVRTFIFNCDPFYFAPFFPICAYDLDHTPVVFARTSIISILRLFPPKQRSTTYLCPSFYPLSIILLLLSERSVSNH